MKYLMLILLFTSFLHTDSIRKIPDGSRINYSGVRVIIDGEKIDLDPNGLVISVIHDKAKDPEAEVILRPKFSVSSMPEPEFVGSKIKIQTGYHQSFRSIFFGKVRAVNISGQGSDKIKILLKCRGSGSRNKKVLKKREPLFDLIFGSNVEAFDLTYNEKGLIKGSVLIQGKSEIRIDHRVSLKGFPSGFNRTVRIIGIIHSLRSQSWTTCLTVKEFK